MSKDIVFSPGNLLKVFSNEETIEIENQWKEVYCKNRQGVRIKDYKWHIFCSDAYPSITDNEGIELYHQQRATEYIILSNYDENAILVDQLPISCNLSDYYVFPPNMAWTMAFTHEDGWCGPYFAMHKNYDVLNEKNIKQIEKNIKIAQAKEKGWM